MRAHFVNTVFVHPIHTVQHVMIISTCTSIRPQRLPPALSSITFHHHNVRFEPTFKNQFQFALHPSLWSEFKACRRVDPVAGDNRRARARDQAQLYLPFGAPQPKLYLLFKIETGKLGGKLSQQVGQFKSRRLFWLKPAGFEMKTWHAWQICTLALLNNWHTKIQTGKR